MGVTIKEIAKKSGFGYGTVVRALSDNPVLIKPETRAKILAVANKYGYVKDIHAQALVSGKTRDLGLLIPAMFESPYYRDFYIKTIIGIMDALKDSEYKLRILFLQAETGAASIRQEALYLKLGGLIVYPYCRNFLIPEEELSNLDLPVVILGKEVSGDSVWSIVMDEFDAGRRGTEYLIGLGHKKIAVLRGFRDDIELRYEGYKKALADNGIDVSPDFIMKGTGKTDSGYELVKDLLGKGHRPTAIFALGDEMAYGAIQAMKEFDLKCPDDISVLGFDDIDFNEFLDPPLTSMARPVSLMGSMAVDILLKNTKYKDKKVLTVVPEPAIRSSCRKII